MSRQVVRLDVPEGSIMAWLLKPRGRSRVAGPQGPKTKKTQYTREQREKGIV